jgi:hypothetical protein
MSKRAALRLANYFRALGYKVQIRQHRTPAGAFWSLEFLAPKKRVVRRRKLVLRRCGADPRAASSTI